MPGLPDSNKIPASSPATGIHKAQISLHALLSVRRGTADLHGRVDSVGRGGGPPIQAILAPAPAAP